MTIPEAEMHRPAAKETTAMPAPRHVTRRSVLKGAAALGGMAIASMAAPTPAVADTSPPRGVRFGVNYVPSQHWWYCWGDWNPKSIREDLRAVAGLGFDHVRIQCLWPNFQPNPNYVSSEALHHLSELLDLADHAGLDVQVTVLDGYLSGFTFLPVWAQGHNLLTDPDMITAQKLLFQAMAEQVGTHRRFLGFDLSNEIDNTFGQQPGGVTADQGDTWASELLDHCAQVAPAGAHVNGVSQNPWLYGYGFSRTAMASTGAHTVAHFYDFSVDGTSSPIHEAEYMVELVHAYAPDPTRQVWLEEFGVSAGPGFGVPPDQLPDFIEGYIRNVMTCANLWGWTLWASHDISHNLPGFSGLEYGFGMLDTNNQPTRLGARVAAVISDLRKNPPAPPDRSTALVIADNASPTLDGVGESFIELITDQHLRPSIVLQSRSSDQAYLRARGITTLITLGEVTVLDGPSYPTLAKAYNNIGITDDTNIAPGNFDLYGDSYSAQALSTAGLTAGKAVTASGITFTWPDVPAGQPDNLNVTGQVIQLADAQPGMTKLGLLAASTNGPASIQVTVAYEDASMDTTSVTLSDWTLNGGAAAPAAGNEIVAKSPYRNCRNCGGRQTINTYLFSTTVPVNIGKTAVKVGLSSPDHGTVNVFAISLG